MLLETLTKNILRLQLNRPDVHNAFHPELIASLTAAFRRAQSNSAVRVVILEGQGPSFCSGADLGWMKSMAQYTFEQNRGDAEKLFELFEAGAQLEKPLIGRVHGNVMGGGLGLVAICDLVAALQDTKFCFSEVKLGLVPSVISPFVLRKSVPGVARRLMITGELFGVDLARECGLVHFSGDAAAVENFVTEKAESLCANGPGAVMATKRLLNFEEGAAWSEIRAETTRVISERRVSAEGQEGLKSFFEKRKPSWRV